MTWFEEERGAGNLTRHEFARAPTPSTSQDIATLPSPLYSPAPPSNLSEIEEYMKRKHPGPREVLRVAEMGRKRGERGAVANCVRDLPVLSHPGNSAPARPHVKAR